MEAENLFTLKRYVICQEFSNNRVCRVLRLFLLVVQVLLFVVLFWCHWNIYVVLFKTSRFALQYP